ncbi:MAG: 2-oxoglutarate dehydrogenase [Candidatus Caccovivens sp.]
MFGKRADGVKVKGMQIIEKAMPYFMPQRIDAVNLYEQALNCENIDKFILEEKKNTGVHYTYTDIMIAACVRMLHERPKTNRFINNCVVYQRKWISISISVKKKLSDDGEEITLKMYFTGRESLEDVKRIFDEELAKAIPSDAETHKTTKVAGFLCKLPNWMFKTAMAIIRWADKHNLLPKKLIDASPFHTSVYVADLRSIKLDAVYHHLYNFGNTTIFGVMGKEFYAPISNRAGEVETKKQMNMRFSLDERVCDGLYYRNSLKLLMNLLENPELLKERLPEPELTGKALKKKLKQDKKEAKRQKKLEKKNKNKKA